MSDFEKAVKRAMDEDKKSMEGQVVPSNKGNKITKFLARMAIVLSFVGGIIPVATNLTRQEEKSSVEAVDAGVPQKAVELALKDEGALHFMGICEDELDAERKLIKVQADLLKNRTHKTVFDRRVNIYAAAAKLARESEVSCFTPGGPESIFSVAVEGEKRRVPLQMQALTPNFDAETLSLERRCATEINAELDLVSDTENDSTAVNMLSAFTRAKYELQAELADKQNIPC